DLCQQAELLWGRELFFDATKVRANAALNSVVPRFYLQAKHQAKEHLADLFAADSEPVVDDAAPGTLLPAENAVAPSPELPPPPRLPTMLTPEAEAQLAEANQAVWKLLDHRRL